jgi:hypothetical protein
MEGGALSPAPVKGVLRLPPTLLRSVFPALRNPANRKKTFEMAPKQFHFSFTNTMNDQDAEAAYVRYAVPAPGRVIFQAAFANLNPHAVTKVDGEPPRGRARRDGGAGEGLTPAVSNGPGRLRGARLRELGLTRGRSAATSPAR